MITCDLRFKTDYQKGHKYLDLTYFLNSTFESMIKESMIQIVHKSNSFKFPNPNIVRPSRINGWLFAKTKKKVKFPIIDFESWVLNNSSNSIVTMQGELYCPFALCIILLTDHWYLNCTYVKSLELMFKNNPPYSQTKIAEHTMRKELLFTDIKCLYLWSICLIWLLG